MRILHFETILHRFFIQNEFSDSELFIPSVLLYRKEGVFASIPFVLLPIPFEMLVIQRIRPISTPVKARFRKEPVSQILVGNGVLLLFPLLLKYERAGRDVPNLPRRSAAHRCYHRPVLPCGDPLPSVVRYVIYLLTVTDFTMPRNDCFIVRFRSL